VRSHVDWGTQSESPTRPLAWDVLDDLATEARAQGVTLQRAALTSIDEMTDPARALRGGARPSRNRRRAGQFPAAHKRIRAGLRNLFALADRFGLALDFHVDEGLDPGLDGLELIADVAEPTGSRGRSSAAMPAASPRAATTTWRGSPTSWPGAGSPWPRCRRRTSTCRAGTRARPTGGASRGCTSLPRAG
jgi:hypothetical protein